MLAKGSLHFRPSANLTGAGINGKVSIHREPFGRRGSTAVELYTLTGSAGLRARITNYGAALVSLEVSDREGSNGDIVLGFDTLEPYLGEHPYFGSVIGRYANRIR